MEVNSKTSFILTFFCFNQHNCHEIVFKVTLSESPFGKTLPHLT